MKQLSIFTDFTEYPGLRHCNISDKSGEEFYHSILNKAFKEQYEKGDKLIVDLDNTAGYASSFLDEAFGNLVFDFTLENVNKYIEIISIQEPHWKIMLEEQSFKQWEERRLNNDFPVVTKSHEPWYRIVNGLLKLEKWDSQLVA